MNVTQNRLTQVFTFLKEMNELRNPVPQEISTYAQVLRLDAGLVTFMLGQPPGRLARRTLLFVREHETWKLAHLHASAAGQP
jgi:hypothetical protein